LTRDLSGEVQVTDLDRALALAARDAADDEAVVDVREAVDPYYDLGAIAENEHLTGHLFTPAEG
jgi:hypothetical protein